MDGRADIMDETGKRQFLASHAPTYRIGPLDE